MRHVQKILMIQFYTIIAMVVLTVLFFESEVIVSGGLAGDTQSEFLFTAMMELVTLCFAFLSLRLFKFEKIRADLISRKEVALQKWGVTRLLLIEAPLVFNTLLYYLYMKPTFGYLAIILVLCLPFVYPTLNRCVAETSEESES